MSYIRPKTKTKISPEDKADVLRDCIAHCQEAFQRDPESLNRKIPREIFSAVLDEVGALLVRRSAEIATGDDTGAGPAVAKFLDENPLPESIEKVLTPQLRTFALLLHALRQWAVAESLATDRWIFSGNVRRLLRKSTEHCVVTGEALSAGETELHHPVRDGRPPLPLSKKGHRMIEKQERYLADDPVGKILVALRRQKRGRYSWKAIWEGCCLHMGETFEFESPNRARFCRSLVNWYVRESGFSVEEIRQWIEGQRLIPDESELAGEN
ncbi:MAG: hypothetical protein JJU00_16725 [Opitutales bacterium]|nr:hypothetical protein [Opitutales bacterium]